MWTRDPNQHPLLQKLFRLGRIIGADVDALLALPFTVRNFSSHEEIAQEKDRATHCFFVLSGCIMRYKLFPDGSRQIFSLHFAGDMPDLQTLHLGIMDHSTATLSQSSLGFITHEALQSFLVDHPGVAALLWRDSLIEAAINRTWMANLGIRPARARVAHFFCEMFVRLRTIGATRGQSFSLPLTQVELGDALGLSEVHISRTLKSLRADSLLSLDQGQTTIDWPRLAAICDYDPTYLHIRDENIPSAANSAAAPR
jgi:CRP-like cAMP-binding protein